MSKKLIYLVSFVLVLALAGTNVVFGDTVWQGRIEDDIDDVLEALGASGGGKDHEITYMTPEYARKSKSVTVRAMQLALILKQTGLIRWKELSALYA